MLVKGILNRTIMVIVQVNDKVSDDLNNDGAYTLLKAERANRDGL